MEAARVEKPRWGRLLVRAMLRFWDARALAIAAVHTPAWFAWMAGPMLLGCLTGWLLHAYTWTIAEPYPDFSPLFDWRAWLATPLGTGLFVGPLLMLTACFFAYSTETCQQDRRKHNAALGRTVLLLPVSLSLPVIAWIPLAVLSSIADPSNGINSGKPAWTTWTVWLVAGSCAWIPVWIGLAFWQLIRAVGALSTFYPAADACARCAYPLADVRGGRCPECGEAFQQAG